MALIRCRECGQNISSNAANCPQCGAPIKESSGGISGWHVAILFIAVIVIGFVVSQNKSPTISTINGGDVSHSDSGSEVAINMAELFVRKSLVAPSTAKFCPHDEAKVVRLDDGCYIVTGWVDAQNSFSAMIRTDWCYEVQPLGGHEWRLVSDDARADLYSHDHKDEALTSTPTPASPPAEPSVPEQQPLPTPSTTPEPSPLVQSTPRPLPHEITLTAAVEMPAVIGGKTFGTITLPPGTHLPLVSVAQGSVTVRYINSTATIPITSTDLQMPAK